MLDIDKVFGFDEKMAKDGVKMILDIKGEQFFLVRRTPNPDYERQLGQEYRRYEKVLKLKTPESEELSQKLMAEVLAKTVLIGWGGISVKGKKLEFTVENATKLLLDYPALRTSIIDFAQEASNFRPTDDPAEIKKP